MADQRKIFSKIYDKYIDKIYRFIFFKVNSQEIAEDLTSETFLKGWKAFQGQEIENPSAFLYQIARNLIVDHYREKGNASFVSVENIQVVDPLNLEERTLLNSDMETIKVELANLRDDYREIIVLRYINEFSFSEIAKILDKSEEASRIQLHRALKSLKNQLS